MAVRESAVAAGGHTGDVVSACCERIRRIETCISCNPNVCWAIRNCVEGAPVSCYGQNDRPLGGHV